MGEGSVFVVLFSLGAPAMVSMFFQNLYSLVDTVFVSWLGTIELAALSLSLPVFYFAMAIVKGVAVGTTALMSHARGANAPDKASAIAAAAMPLALMLLAPFCLLIFPGINHGFFGLFGVEKTVLVEADKFLFWLVWTFPAMGFAMICEGILLSYGDAKTPMKAMIAGNLLNMALDPILIFTCKMGIAGASLASFIGWALPGCIMWYVLKKRKKDRPHFWGDGNHVRAWKKIFVMGGPVALAMLVMPISAAGLNYVLAPFGPAYMGAWTLSARMEQMIILPLIGLSCSLIPFAGFNLGAGNGVRIREAVRILILVCYGILVPVSVILWICAPGVIGLFRPDSQVLSLSVHAFRLALLGYWLGPMELIVTGLAQGVKRPRYTLFINVSRLLVLRLPLAFLFASLWGGRGVYISHTVSLLVSGLVCLFILRHLLLLVDRDCTRKQ